MTMTNIPGEALEGQGDTGACRHHWVIEAPEGPVSIGRCRVCGQSSHFKNFIDSTPWGEDGREPDPQPQDAGKIEMATDLSDLDFH